LQASYKRFHFKELDWTITFPPEGNRGKYSNYQVTLQKTPLDPELQMRLGEILDSPEFEEHCPHTVGYYKTAPNEHGGTPQYLELRKIKSVEDFWHFLNSLNL
jgi:hypothetical protein